jgi:NRPS condensation-like uncharacterized protein
MTERYERDLDLSVHAERVLLMLPLNAVIAARIRGEIQRAELQSAVERLRRRHALLAVRFVLDDKGAARYETADVGEIPVRAVDAIDGEDWLRAVRQECMTSFPIEAGPLVRFALIRSTDHFHLVIAGHHAICDGISLTFLVRDVLETLVDAGSNVEVLPPPPPIDDTTVPSPPQAGLVERWLVRLLNRKWEKQGISFDQADMERLHEEFWRRNGEPVALAWNLSESATAALVERCRQEQVTVNSALWAAFLAAQHEVQGDAEAFRSQAGMAVSTRDKLSVPVGDALGFYASSLTAELKHDPSAGFWEGARRIHGAIRQALQKTDLFRMLKAEALPPTLLDSLYFAKYGLINNRLSNRTLARMRWSGTSYGFSITNVGRSAIPLEYGARTIEAVYGPFVYSDVNEKVVGVTTVGGRMAFSLTCNAEAVGADLAERIQVSAMARLAKAVG